ncbi:MAG: phosphatidylserine decarboxylase, partial [Acidobacteriota bacterium]|nr:phosphatidylserine decarboxylase [Acidobacteriota bacterium]
VGLPLYILAAFCIYFFRDPERVSPPGSVMVSPADGKVVAVKDLGNGQTRVSVFLNIFDVHVNRTPIPGKIAGVVYQKGKFLIASHEAASSENEQNTLIVEGQNTRVVCRQIAGLIARRIICYKRAGDAVSPAERIGYIKFGSRVDLIYGPEWRTVVKVGDRVSAGSSVVADWAARATEDSV